MLGTAGGKVGVAAGIVAAASLAAPVTSLTPGACFFEGGCGRYEHAGLVFAALILLAVALIVGMIVRFSVNALIYRGKSRS